MKILLVEDDATILESLAMYLEMLNFSVAKARDVETALEIIANSPPQICITDYQLGGRRSGLDVLRATALAGIPCVMVTGSAEPRSIRATAKEAGAAEFIEKPYHPSELIRAIERIASTHPPA